MNLIDAPCSVASHPEPTLMEDADRSLYSAYVRKEPDYELPRSFDVRSLLHLAGRALRAGSLSLVLSPPTSRAITGEEQSDREWLRIEWPESPSVQPAIRFVARPSNLPAVGNGERTFGDKQAIVAWDETESVHVLSTSRGSFLGCLIVHVPKSHPRDVDLLTTACAMISGYVERYLDFSAATSSSRDKGRAKTFPAKELPSYREVIEEGVWQVTFPHPIPVTLPIDEQSRRIHETARISDCNSVVAGILGMASVQSLVGRSLRSLIGKVAPQAWLSFVKSGYELHHYDIRVRMDGTTRLFFVNAAGYLEDGCLSHVWGSVTEMTDDVQIDRDISQIQELEQMRLGRDLHDSVGPLVTGLRLLSDNLASGIYEDPAHTREVTLMISRYAEEALRRLRQISHGLARIDVEGVSLVPSLESLANNIAQLRGSTVTFERTNDADITDGEDKLQLYRIVQEAVQNATKHSGALALTIGIGKDQDTTFVYVRDDGCGFDVKAVGNKSQGLANMRHRARAIGATLRITSEPGRGTTVHCSLPS